MRTSTRIALNAVTRWLGLIVSVIVGIIIVPIMIGQFGKDGYGLIAICFALLSLRSLLDFGLRAAIIRQLAAAIGEKDHKRYSELVNSALMVYLLIGGVTALICWFFAPLLANGLKVPPHLLSDGTFLIRLYAGPTFFFVFAIAPMASILSANGRFDLLNYIEAGSQILRAIGIIFVLTVTSWGMNGWAAVEVLVIIFHMILVTVIARKIGFTVKINLFRAKFGALPFSTSIYTFLLAVSDQISTTSDNFVLSSFLGPGAVGLYQPGRLLSRRLRPVIDAIKDQLHPLATSRFAEKRFDQVQSILIEGTRYRLLMGLGACVGLGIYAPHLTQVWLGGTLDQIELNIVAKVMTIWAATDLITYSGGSQWPVLFGMKEFGFLVRLGLPLSLINLIVSILVVGYTDAGVFGVVIPTFCMEIIRVGITYRYCCRCLKMSLFNYFQSAYARPLIVLISLLVVAESVRRIIMPDTIILLVICALICATAWSLLVWFIGLGSAERKQIAELLHAAYKKLSGTWQLMLANK